MSENSIISYIKELNIYSVATDPVYIGTGGYTIGRVDNTIVRDPITKIPKIPGSSIAGTWRYYMALELISKVKDYQPNFDVIKKELKDKETNIYEKLTSYNWKNLTDENKKKFEQLKDWIKFIGNQIAKITCAGQDNVSEAEIDSPDAKKNGRFGHCGHCIVCKSFGFSKKDLRWQGMLFFSDLNILFFPVYTRLGVKWITSERILKDANLIKQNESDKNEDKNKVNNRSDNNKIVYVLERIEDDKIKGYINLGWLNLPYKIKSIGAICELSQIDDFSINKEDIIIVPDSLISQIINSNLEVRTSVSIDPITGASKEGALFTSEAIPRGTVFYGKIRIFNKSAFKGIDSKIGNLPKDEWVQSALCDSKKYYETLGIGGMTTRGFGRMKVELVDDSNPACQENGTASTSSRKGEK